MTTKLKQNVQIDGQLSATTKSFDIEHPTKEGKRLHHGVLEGPEHAACRSPDPGRYPALRMKRSVAQGFPQGWR